MEWLLSFVAAHGAPVVFLLVFADQLGVPIPSVPILLTLGALAGAGRLDPVSGLAVAAAGSLCADFVWYELGRRKGSRMLGLMCKLSLEPDSCVSRTEGLFARHGVKSLLVAKFVPGYDTVAPPLAGLLGVRTVPFVLWSLAGAVLWLGTYCGVGYVFSDRIAEIAARAESLGSTLGWIVLAAFAGYIVFKVAERQRVLHGVRTARITPDELHAMIVSGGEPILVDVRNADSLGVVPVVIPGARMIPFDEIEARHGEIPREKDVIVYCS